MGSHAQILVFCYPCMRDYDCGALRVQIFSDHDISECIFQENMSLETSNISLESTQNKQQYDTKITCTE